MNEDDGATNAREVVASLVESGFITEPRAGDAELRVVRITSPDGAPAGWFVALVVADRLIGFVQLDEALRFRRYSSFAGKKPAAPDWLEAGVVLSRARKRAAQTDTLGEPRLSYDRSPDRLAWVVPATGSDGIGRRIFVVGREVFERRE